MGADESVPFMKPLDEAKMEELTCAEKAWSGWLAMEDWMVGPRAPDESAEGSRVDAYNEHMHAQANEQHEQLEQQDLPNGTVESVE